MADLRTVRLNLPATLADLRALEIGTVAYLTGRVFTARETAAIHRAVSILSDAELSSRFDAADMREKEIYPQIWSRSRAEGDPLAYLLEYVALLRAFLSATVRMGLGMVVIIT